MFMLSLNFNIGVEKWDYKMVEIEKEPNIELLSDVRKPTTRDIAVRLGVLSADRVILRNFPQRTPLTVFNSSLKVENEKVYLFARLILGYYTYSSVIARIIIPLSDVLKGTVSENTYEAEIIIGPDTEIDFWGSEDPRVQKVGDIYSMIYTGRTIRYFNPLAIERTVPAIALTKNVGGRWLKVGYFTLPKKLREETITNKDTVLLDVGRNIDEYYVLHRPHLKNYPARMWIGKISKTTLTLEEPEKPKPMEVKKNRLVLKEANFETKVGWGAPPVKIKENEWILIAHGVGKDEVYRLFAIKLTYDGGELRVSGITPSYIMEPRTQYEKYGDRPNVVFICGAERISKNRILITYGCADSFTGFAEIAIDELLSEIKEV